MGMYDRDWYRDSIKNQSQNRKNRTKNRINPYFTIFLFFLLLFILLPIVGRFTPYRVTVSLILLNCLVFILIKLKKFRVSDLGSSYRTVGVNGECYRVVSAAFTHEEPLHIIFNMGSLYNLGEVLEKNFGSWMFLLFYVVIMILGGTASVIVHKKKSPFILSIGASGVICGLLGVYLVYAIHMLGIMGIKSVLPSLLMMVLMTASKKIDSIGHFTGLATGLICGILLINI